MLGTALRAAEQSLEDHRKLLRGGAAFAGRTGSGGVSSTSSHEAGKTILVATGTGPIELRPQDAVAAVVVMVCNRPEYLRRTIKSILE